MIFVTGETTNGLSATSGTMEKWQISFVEKNLPDLLGNIFPNKTFLAFLQQKKLLSVEECENAVSNILKYIEN